MRASLRTVATLGLALCASLVPGAIGADNVDANGNPCTNSVNGVTTAATDIDEHTTIIGCGNVVANNSAVNDDFTLEIKGSRNIVRDNVEQEGSNTFSVYGDDNKFIANEADYFFLGSDTDGARSYNNDVERNVARSRGSHGWIGFTSTNGSTIIGNDADYIAGYAGLNNNVQGNKAGSAEHPGYVKVDGKGNTVTGNVARGGGARNSGNNAYVEVTTSDSGNTLTGNEADYIGTYDSYNNTFTGNTAGTNPGSTGYMWLSSDTSNVVEGNQAGDYMGIYSDENSVIRNNQVASEMEVGSDMNVTVESNTVSDGDLYSYSNENTVDKGNHMKYYHGVYDADHSKFINNKASSDYMGSDHYVDVESNEADYSFKIRYANYGPYYDEASDYNMGWDLGAPVTGVCASFAANSTASPVTTSLPATPCPVTVPAGAMLTAGTTKVPGGVCTGDTVIKLVNGEDDTDLAAPGNNRNGNGNAVANDDYGSEHCSLVQYINGGEEAMTIHIVANCYVDGSDVESDCSGTVGYDVRGLKTSVVKGNKADYIYMDYVVGADIENNVADYGMDVTDTFDLTLKNNTGRYIEVTSDYSTNHHVSFVPTVITGNKVDLDLKTYDSNNITLTKNAVHNIDISTTSDLVYDGLQQSLTKPMSIEDDHFTYSNHGSGHGQPIFGESLRFTTIGSGEITAITDDATAVSEDAVKTTAVSAKQVLAMNTQAAAMAASMTAATTAGAAADAALQALITSLAAEVATLKSGFCPPAAGRHLLSTLTPIVPPAGCPGAGGSVTPPPAVTNPTNIITTTLTISGINPATFSSANVAAALATHAGINPADIDVVVTDFPVTTTVSFNGVALTSLTAAQMAGIETAIDTNLPATAMTPALGAVAAGRRRLLDLSFPVTVTGVGADPVLAAQTAAAIVSAATLGATATAAGISVSAVAATPATVSVTMTNTIRAASAASASAIAAALSPANAAAISAALTAAGVSNTGVTISAPVVAEAPKPASSSSSKNLDLLALLVLLIIPIANAAYFGGKYLERKRAAKEQAQSKGIDSVVVVETA